MVVLTKLDGSAFALNCDLIETISANPDTTIRLVNDKIIIVRETLQEVIQKTIDYRKQIYQLVISEPLVIEDKSEQ